jgi:hypothetical protein
MNEQEKLQVCNVINNFLEAKGFFPYLIDLETHPMFWPLFKNLEKEQKEDIEKIIDECIVEKLNSYKTKWW